MIDWSNFQNKLQERGRRAELSRQTGISTGNIRDWFNPDKPAQPSADALVKISKALDCSVDYLLGLTDVEKITSEPTTIYRFPVFRQEAAAGVGRLDVSDGYSMENFVIDNLPNEATFIMEIAGESMYDEKTDYLIHTGSKVLVDPQTTKYNLDEKIVIANFRGKTICKRYIVKDSYILFQSDNDAFDKENRKSTDDPDHKIIGVVLGVIENEKFVPVK
jgi:SOS-response transcriptional repressor LexA